VPLFSGEGKGQLTHRYFENLFSGTRPQDEVDQRRTPAPKSADQELGFPFHLARTGQKLERGPNNKKKRKKLSHITSRTSEDG